MGGAGQCRSCRATVAASCWPAGDVARVAGLVGCRRGHGVLAAVGHGLERVWGVTRQLGRTARAIHMLWAHPEHARDVLDEMPGWPRGRG